MIWESGENWYLRPTGHWPTISVIERGQESYDEYADRRERERTARRVPFGFGRALADDESPADPKEPLTIVMSVDAFERLIAEAAPAGVRPSAPGGGTSFSESDEVY